MHSASPCVCVLISWLILSLHWINCVSLGALQGPDGEPGVAPWLTPLYQGGRPDDGSKGLFSDAIWTITWSHSDTQTEMTQTEGVDTSEAKVRKVQCTCSLILAFFPKNLMRRHFCGQLIFFLQHHSYWFLWLCSSHPSFRVSAQRLSIYFCHIPSFPSRCTLIYPTPTPRRATKLSV